VSRNNVIMALDRDGWKLRNEIAKDAGMSKYEAKKFLNLLEDEGFVERREDPHGRVLYRPTRARR